MLVTESISCSTADHQLVLLVIQMFGLLFHTVMLVYIYHVLTSCYTIIITSLLLPFFYYEEVSPSCVYIGFLCYFVWFLFYSQLKIRWEVWNHRHFKVVSGFRDDSYMYAYFLFSVFFTTHQLICCMFPNFGTFSSVLYSLSCINFSPCFHDPLEPVLFLGTI